MSRPLISIVVPVMNEEDSVGALHRRVTAVMEGAGVDHEIIFAMDPSSDRTDERIMELRAADPRVKLVRLSRRFGQPAATVAGLQMASGDAAVVIDCDLQDPPELIVEMIARWQSGFDVVYAQRRSRAGETLAKRVISALGYRVIRRVSEVQIPVNTGDFRLMSRRVLDEILRLNETHGFLRGMVALVGFSQSSVLYDRDPRLAGDGKYNKFTGSFRIGINGIVGFSRYPLQLITWMGLLTFSFAMLLALTYLVLRLAGVDIVWGNPTIVMIVSFFSGVQLLAIGVMGEYVGRIYDEVKGRPMFIVESLEGFERRDRRAAEDDVTRRVGGAPHLWEH